MSKKLECRIVITRYQRADLKTEVGMYDPVTERYVPLGAHGPLAREVDKVVTDLKRKLEQAGNTVTFCER